MTRGLHSASLAAVIAAALASTIAAQAEVNRVLPFWSEPYPIGFTRTVGGLSPRSDRCRVWRRVRTRHGLRTVAVDRCRSVLHARD